MNSYHPNHAKKAIAFSQATRILCICSDPATTQSRCNELIEYLVRRGHGRRRTQLEVQRATDAHRNPQQYIRSINSGVYFMVQYRPGLSDIKGTLKKYYWLPVKVRSTYKIACLCYHCHSSTAPSYVTDMLHKKPLHTRNTRSSSYTMPLLNRPAHSKATLGDRSFSFASSSVWNSIPNDVRCAPSLSSFKSRLKTYLFRSVYID